MLIPFRRVVTGHTPDGRSTVLFDGTAYNTAENPRWPGRGPTAFWYTDGAPADLQGNEDAADRPFQLEPPPRGTTFMVTQVMPESDHANRTPEELEAVMQAQFATNAHVRADKTRHPMMHRTRTIDYLVLLQGEVTLLLEEGEVTLKPFDVVVQRGTNHAWVNRGSEPALLGVVLVDAIPFSRE